MANNYLANINSMDKFNRSMGGFSVNRSQPIQQPKAKQSFGQGLIGMARRFLKR